MKVEVKNLQGEKVGDITLQQDVFGVVINEELLHGVYIAQNANKRQSTAHTKTISDRAGSTRKPWKQKGTGRARTGSVRNSIWRKGGVVFGPSNEKNYKQKINKKVAKQAFCMALSGKLADGEIVIVDELKMKDNKTKGFVEVMKALGINKKAVIAFVEEEKQTTLASRNLKEVTNTLVSNLNVVNILNNKFLIISRKGIEVLESRCLAQSTKEEAVVEKATEKTEAKK
jgi:large subunit ribosomal protein L4